MKKTADAQLIITLDGYLSEGNRVSIRTLSHTLPYLQRAIDKLVIYERRGVVGKNATLHQAEYQLADLYLENIEKGSIILPLVGNLLTGVANRFDSFLNAPYKEAENSLLEKTAGFDDKVEITRTLISNGKLEPISHDELLETQKIAARDYAQSAFLNDINNMIAPLRSSLCKEDLMTISNVSGKEARTYVFNNENSKAFAKVVKEQRLSHPVKYIGRLEGLINRGGTTFPFVGKFFCKTTKKERKLLVASEQDALELNKHNLGSTEIRIVACPLATYGAFDPLAGDLVFIGFYDDRKNS